MFTNRHPLVLNVFRLFLYGVCNRGESLQAYSAHLSHNMRRSIQAIRVTTNAEVAVKMMTICVNQWVASLCSRMLKEIVGILEEYKMDLGGLAKVLDGLENSESNLWFSEVCPFLSSYSLLCFFSVFFSAFLHRRGSVCDRF